ncbi:MULTISPECIES: bifunctional phosphopantothenoylcysteine decarboxylase/phosphopantothenate--cysteine ligase CoaBC [Gammaproteobacteria]|uniref:bifunctional phosphopantothenoylcysteine decarboxylase/phosphopantothenate--cysteine ligase CoaBC n=1 Tax=Gammaproteobacteria TaxID=1236 RepID=UPI000DD0A8D1|nr:MULTISPECIES: bifunctional phosphopantothenoylcysteine decarboxylase/phosphopantothenate--cysteine ligase CoaBC [Gammaproteobacteria]RTE86501.1 bifunctional phosphopantothenoylcysteine decarboxylase/phosphopantothenate--cysteine ligase CoaBC [Aliidiomarina sp. B3213]TCZ90944.1 bifunctional phosphopantothenoylcysteine decarboxylase/phosphopantothenate--cysteine ligase CoaBC [Lysobacter sp. N42]
MASLKNCNLLLIVTGGIAAYKTPELVRRLRDQGVSVRVVMTKGAQAFITPLTLQAVSGHPVHDDLLDPAAEAAMGHIELARWADLVVVAPASASAIARLAHGHADDLFSTLCLATDAPIAVVPAMNRLMWAAPAVQRNVELLQQDGKLMWGPAEGSQACGEVGAGRMIEPADIVANVENFFHTTAHLEPTGELAGQHVVITAGPTREAIDPVRYLSNHSSGKMGFALAEAAASAGAQVTLIAGPVQLDTPPGVDRIDIQSAQEMLEQVQRALPESDIFIGCAAVADFRAMEVADNKMKKSAEQNEMTITLTKNPDILAWVASQSNRPFTVGFAAETQNVEEYATRKLRAKNIDMIVANDVSKSGQGFNSDNNAVEVYWPLNDKEHGHEAFASRSKQNLAKDLIQLIYKKKQHG